MRRERETLFRQVSSSPLNLQGLSLLCTIGNKGRKGDFAIKLEVVFTKEKLGH